MTSLIGRQVTVYVLTYDDAMHPIFFGRLHAATVGDGVEFGLEYEGAQNGVDVAPNLIDIGPHSIEISYAPAPPGALVTAAFNGYIFEFTPKCLQIAGARLDREATNVRLDDSALSVHGNAVRLNVSGLTYDRDSRIVLAVDPGGCPV